MIVSDRHKVVLISMPRCCSHSLGAVLVEEYGGRRVFENNRGRPGHLGAHCNSVPPECEDYFIWTLCRNPYTRAASMYWYLLKHPERDLLLETFDEFTEQILARVAEWRHGPLWPMYQQVAEQRIDHIVRFENLVPDLEQLPFWRKGTELPMEGMSKPDCSLAELLTPKCVDRIRRWAGPDFERFGYSLEPPI